MAASMAAVVFARLSGVLATAESCALPRAAERLSRLCEGLAASTESDDPMLVSLVSPLVGKVSASVSIRESFGLLVLAGGEVPLVIVKIASAAMMNLPAIIMKASNRKSG